MGNKVIIFDLFGVVFTKGLKSSIEKLETAFDLPANVVSKAYSRWEKPFDEGKINSSEFWNLVNKDLGTEVNPIDLSNIVLSSYSLQSKIIELIAHLKKHFVLVVCSNYRKEWFDILDRKYALSDKFERVFISSETGKLKPNSEVFDMVLEEVGGFRKDYVLIDDDERNIFSFNQWGGQGILFEDTYSCELTIRRKYPNYFEKYKEEYSGIILIYDNDFVILQRRDDNNEIENPNMLSVFGGRSKKYESPIECAIRELREETSLDVNKKDLELYKELSYPSNNGHWIFCSYFILRNFAPKDINLREGQKIEMKKWSDAIVNEEVTEIPRFLFSKIHEESF